MQSQTLEAPVPQTLFFIGGSDIGGGFGTWPGLIDEVRLYNRALSDAEIKALYDATK
jgi:hypothetical protein